MAKKKLYFQNCAKILLILLMIGGSLSVVIYYVLLTASTISFNSELHDISNRSDFKSDNTIVFTKVHKTRAKSKKLIEIVNWPITKVLAGRMRSYSIDHKKLEKIGCQLKMSRNQKDVDTADAVLFFMFWERIKKKDLPNKHHSDQTWIFIQRESSPWTVGPHLNGLFNWTITFRKDSDIYNPYFVKVPKHSSLPPSSPIRIAKDLPLDKFIRGKRKLAVAVISHCNAGSRRDQIIKTLKSFNVSIDVFGNCGKPLKESRRNITGESDVFQKLAKDYKFFLAFENSICADYITEKFWRSLEIGMVPVVLGRGDYLTDAPPNSFIDIRDYPDPNDLRNYLQRLDKNDTEYSKYFEWRRGFDVKMHSVNNYEICQRLKERRKQCEVFCKPQVYTNFDVWWKNEPGKTNSPACVPPQKIGLGKYIK